MFELCISNVVMLGLLQISHIPGIRSVLGKKDNLCQITSASTGKTPAGMCT